MFGWKGFRVRSPVRRTRFRPPFKAIKAEPIDDSSDESLPSRSEPMAGPSGSAGHSSVGQVSDCRPSAIAEDGTQLIPVSALPNKYRAVFIHRFPYFNVVQSKVFEDVIHSDKSIALCAPTSSGKTVVFELALIKQLMDFDSRAHPLTELRAVYMAPLKKLVDEKFKEFRDAFDRFGLNCIQFTGDSDIEEYTGLSIANIVLTTPEKWDAMVRVNQNSALVRNIQLMLIDEIHSIGDDSRGATMEAIISRMKTLRTVQMKENTEIPRLRFVAVSATAPNVNDIAHWLDPIDSVGHNLSVNCRPVRIQTIVIGYPFNDGTGEYKFDINLNYKLDSVIKSNCDSKPTLIFCSTRKMVVMAAKHLANSSSNYFNNERQRMKMTNALLRITFKDKDLKNIIQKGIAFHHSGVELQDRRTVENLFIDNMIPVLVSTTTLAMGVNLPAHLVIIKNTVQFEPNGVVKEYPPQQVMQMIGRAGRPQFDTSATAIIMTKITKKSKYEKILNGTQIIESKLNEHLVEHLNAEIALRTVTSMDIAVDWIRSTFLYIRLLQNPGLYSSTLQITNIKQGLEVLRDWCRTELNDLKSYELVAADRDFAQVSSTALGQFMARHCVSFATMKKFIGMIDKELELRDIIEEICKTQELINEIQLRVHDKKVLNELNASKEQTCIRFPFSGKIKNTEMKISCLIQATLGSLTISEATLNQECLRVFRTAQRLSRCLSDIMLFKVQQKVHKIYFNTLLNVLILNKSFKAKLWNDSNQVIKQMPKIGNQYSKAIMSHYKNFDELRRAHPREIEFACGNRKAPFGTQVVDWVKRLPFYSLTISQNLTEGLKPNRAMIRVKVKLENLEDLRTKELVNKTHSTYIIVGNDQNQLFHCQQLSDTKLFKVNGIWETNDIIMERSVGLNTAYAYLISDSFVGLDVRCALTLEFAADTQSAPPEPSQTNCSTAYSNVSCETESRPNSSEGCQHKCANKTVCRHSCCKKGLIGQNRQRSETQSQTQSAKNKRHLNAEQSSAKKSKIGSVVPKNNLDKWLIKYPKVNVSEEEVEKSKYFKKYSEIPDNDLELDIDYSEFDTELEDITDSAPEDYIDNGLDAMVVQQVKQEPIETIWSNREVPEEDFEVFDEEFEKIVESHPLLGCNEDFQTFDENINNTNVSTEVKLEVEEMNTRMSSVFDSKKLGIAMDMWGIHFPANCEGKTYFDPKKKC